MAALTSPRFVILFACSWIFVLCQERRELKVTAGENATLQCLGHGYAAITVLRWIRPDLKSDDGYVFFFRDGRSYEIYQHESFCGRVELRDPEMKDGDASVILKNININDAGTYECRVKEGKDSGKVELISIVMLTVTEPSHTAGHEERGDKEGGDEEGGKKEGGNQVGGNKEGGNHKGNVGLKVGLSFGVILLVGVVFGVFFFK